MLWHMGQFSWPTFSKDALPAFDVMPHAVGIILKNDPPIPNVRENKGIHVLSVFWHLSSACGAWRVSAKLPDLRDDVFMNL